MRWVVAMSWDAFQSQSWARTLGLAHSPLFGGAIGKQSDHAVLMDGRKSSFAILIGDDPEFLFYDQSPLSWAWSAFLRSLVAVDIRNGKLFIRHWSEPSRPQAMTLPKTPDEAWTLCDRIATIAPRSAVSDVVTRMITAFKWLRANLSGFGAPNSHIIAVFNELLGLAFDSQMRSQLLKCETVSDAWSLKGSEARDDLRGYGKGLIAQTVQLIVESESDATKLEPSLLIRHASGHLYQEAHFELERTADRQRTLDGGFEPNLTTKGTRRRDARFTPPELAKSLVDQSLKIAPLTNGVLRILDPACGCGVFLTATVQELERRGYLGAVELVGFDESEVATEICRFCLSRAKVDAAASGIDVSYKVETKNAFDVDWGKPDVVLMNPPFTRWRDMSVEDQGKVSGILSGVKTGHPDKAMAFVTKAAQTGGIIATVIPSTMLDGETSEPWRAELLESYSLSSVGRFNGYSYFPGAIVEPAFFVMSPTRVESTPSPLTVVLAENGAEDRALRELRRLEPFHTTSTADVFVSSEVSHKAITPVSWMPRTFRHGALLKTLTESHPKVGDLFDVRQGALTGLNKAFVLSEQQYDLLGDSEKVYFKVAASTPTIRKGCILHSQYVFFPYSQCGLVIEAEDDLKGKLPRFYRELLSHKTDLAARAGFADKWWELTRPRNLDKQFSPKIVTAYFGGCGSFAFDNLGESVSTHGYLWIWNENDAPPASEDDEPIAFTDTDAPWAYLALLNSPEFEFLLSCFCSRVQGGQHNLSKRYVSEIPLPDFVHGPVSPEVLLGLANQGRMLHAGKEPDESRSRSLVSRAFGVPPDAWPQ